MNDTRKGSVIPVSGASDGIATLHDLVVEGGMGFLDLVAAPAGLGRRVGAARVVGPGGDASVGLDDVVLVIGGQPTDPLTAQLIEHASQAGASAVVLRGGGEVTADLVLIAETMDIAVLRVPPAVGWDEVYSLVDAVAHRAGSPSDTELGAVPLGDLIALADAVAAAVGGPVTIEDVHSQVLAYSTGTTSLEELDEPRRQSILGRRTPENWMRKFADAGVFRRFWAGEGVVRIDEFVNEGLRPRLVAPMRAGGEVVGSIWVAQDATPFGPEAEAALLEASRIAASHVLRRRATHDLARRLRSDMLRSLFDGRAAPESVAEQLGIDPATPLAVIAFEGFTGTVVEAPILRERLLSLIWFSAEAGSSTAACVFLDATCYALLPADAADSRALLSRLARDIVARAEDSLGVRLRAGVGSTLPGLRGAARSRHEADQILSVLRGRGDEVRVADIEDVRSLTVLSELRGLVSRWEHLRSTKLAAVRAHDGAHQSGYIDTMRAYLDAFGDVGVAAARIGIHPNTFRYRLRRLTGLSGIDLLDPEERLVITLELTLPEPSLGARRIDCP